jgi:esterase/lipase
MIMNIHCFFLEENEKRIYCSEYIAESTIRRDKGILLCKPIWGERIRTSRIFHNLALFLQDKGYDVFTCDYYGDGNSYGESHELTFDGMVGNIIALRKYISDNHNLNSISIIGLRVGANCAIESVKKNKNFKSMILVEPILNLVDYLKEVLRSNLSNQMTLYKKITKTREVLIEELKSGI